LEFKYDRDVNPQAQKPITVGLEEFKTALAELRTKLGEIKNDAVNNKTPLATDTKNEITRMFGDLSRLAEKNYLAGVAKKKDLAPQEIDTATDILLKNIDVTISKARKSGADTKDLE